MALPTEPDGYQMIYAKFLGGTRPTDFTLDIPDGTPVTAWIPGALIDPASGEPFNQFMILCIPSGVTAGVSADSLPAFDHALLDMWVAGNPNDGFDWQTYAAQYNLDADDTARLQTVALLNASLVAGLTTTGA